MEGIKGTQQKGALHLERPPSVSPYELEPVVAGDKPLYSCNYECASILICKIMNLEEVLFFLPAPEQLVWLHNLHVCIDSILKRIPAMKIDHSGDNLQFVSGTENEDMDHASTLVTLAKELSLLGNKVKLPNGQPLQVQMGMHTGECTTAVVGSLALKHSIFGEALTVAKQLESLSAPGLLRISAESKKRVKGNERWVHGGSLTLADWSKVETYLLGAAADTLSPADIRSAHAAFAQGARAMGPLLNFYDQRLELPYLRLQDGALKRFDIIVLTSFLVLTVLSVASLAMQNRIVLPDYLRSSSGDSSNAIPIQLAVGTILAWLAGIAIVAFLPGEQHPFVREPVCMFLRVVLSVHRVQSIYLALPGCLMFLLPTLQERGNFSMVLEVPEEYSGMLHAAPVALLSILLIVRVQKSVLAAAACTVSEILQLSILARQGAAPSHLKQHAFQYLGLAVLIPTVVLYGWGWFTRLRYLASIQ